MAAQISTRSSAGVRSSVGVSPYASNAIVRSRVWSEDIVKDWNEHVTGLESTADRVERYLRYFTLSDGQLQMLCSRMTSEIDDALERRKDGRPANSLSMIDSRISSSRLPEGQWKGAAGAVDFSGCSLKVGHAVYNGATVKLTSSSGDLRDMKKSQYAKGLADAEATALELFDLIADLLPSQCEQVGLSFAFPVEQLSLNHAVLQCWSRNVATGRATDDPVEGSDVGTLLQCAIERKGSKALVTAVVNDAVACLVAGRFELPKGKCRCVMSLVAGLGFNAAVVLPDARIHGYEGDILNMELGAFDNSLPLNDVDLEVDFADAAGQGRQLLEKMIGAEYLGELCRRLVIKIWQSEAPVDAWQRRTLPWTAAASLLDDSTPDRETSGIILQTFWNWDTTLELRMTVQKLWEAVFDRAAALAALSVIAVAKRTGYLQPALGGLSCSLGGEIFEQCPKMVERLKRHVHRLLLGEKKEEASGAASSTLISFHVSGDAALKGAAILALHHKK